MSLPTIEFSDQADSYSVGWVLNRGLGGSVVVLHMHNGSSPIEVQIVATDQDRIVVEEFGKIRSFYVDDIERIVYQ